LQLARSITLHRIHSILIQTVRSIGANRAGKRCSWDSILGRTLTKVVLTNPDYLDKTKAKRVNSQEFTLFRSLKKLPTLRRHPTEFSFFLFSVKNTSSEDLSY